MSYAAPLQECEESYPLEEASPLLPPHPPASYHGRERKVGSSELLKDGSVIGGCEREIVERRFQLINCWRCRNDRKSSAERLTPTQGQDADA